MQGKRKIAPAPAEHNVAMVIVRELDAHHAAMKERSKQKPHSNSILSAAYAPIKDEQCCVVQ